MIPVDTTKDTAKKDAAKKDDSKKGPAKPEEKPKPPFPGWELDAPKQIAECKHGAGLLGCWFDPSGKWLYTSGQDNVISRWDFVANKRVDLAGHGSWVKSLGFWPGKNFVISGGYEGLLIVWPIEGVQPEPLRQVTAHTGWIRAVAVEPTNGLVVSAGNDGQIALWQLPSLAPVRRWSGHDCHIYQAAFRDNGKEIITADLKANVRVWDTATGKLLREGKPVASLHKFDAGFGADIGGVRGWGANANGDRVACAGITNVSNAFAGVGNPLIQVIDPKTLKVVQEHKSKEAYQGTMWGVAFHPAGFVLGVAGGSGGMLWIWKADQAEPLRTLKQPDNIRGMALSADGSKIAVAQANGSARVLNLKA